MQFVLRVGAADGSVVLLLVIVAALTGLRGLPVVGGWQTMSTLSSSSPPIPSVGSVLPVVANKLVCPGDGNFFIEWFIAPSRHRGAFVFR